MNEVLKSTCHVNDVFALNMILANTRNLEDDISNVHDDYHYYYDDDDDDIDFKTYVNVPPRKKLLLIATQSYTIWLIHGESLSANIGRKLTPIPG